MNDFPADTSFNTILITGSNYDLSGNRIALADDIRSSGTGNSLGFDMLLGTDSLVSIAGSVTGNIALAGHTLTLQNTDLQGAISGNGDVITSGSVTLRSANSYTGTTTVSGTLNLHDPLSLGTADGTVATGIQVNQGGRVQLHNGITVVNERLVGNESVDFNSFGSNTWAGDVEITGDFLNVRIGTAGSTLEFSGSFTTTVSFGGILDISRDSHLLITGSMDVPEFQLDENVTLEVNGTLQTTRLDGRGSSSILLGTGTITGGSYRAVALSPDGLSDPGILQLNGLSSNSQTIFPLELNGSTAGTEYDQLQVTGGVSLAGRLNVSIGTTLVPNTEFTIISNDGTDAVNGTFNGLAEGDLVVVGSDVLRISYQGGDGNDVALTATDARVWDGGGGDNLWTTAANWSGDVAPVAGVELVFPVSVPQTANVNDFPADTGFNTILITGSNYDLSGNRIALADDIRSSGTGNSLGFDMLLGTDSLVSIAGSVTGNIALAGHTLTLQNTDLQGAISGNGDVITSGSVTLRSANSYTGTTTVSGTLNLHDPLSLGRPTERWRQASR